MNSLKLYSFSLILFVIFALGGCPEESDNLVNPPSQAETVNIRFINLASDNKPRELVFAGEKSSGSIQYANSSEAFNPPADSAVAVVYEGDTPDFEPEKLYKFFRKLTYTYIAMPTAPGDSTHPDPVDTLIFYNTSLTIPENTNDAFIRFVNAYPDTSVTFSLINGCAGGQVLAPNLPYRRISNAENVLSGDITFSVFQNSNEGTKSLGLFSANVSSEAEYSIIIYESQSGNPDVLLLNEKDTSPMALQKASKVEANITNFRTLNYTNQEISVNVNGNLITSDLQSRQIDQFRESLACQGIAGDSISVLINGDTTSSSSASLQVLQDYSLFVFNAGVLGKTTQILAEPFKLFNDNEGKSNIRVVNAHPDFQGITVAFGARNVSTDSEDKTFTQGTAIAKEVSYGTISQAASFESGSAPITVFSSTQPAEYLFGFNFDLQPNQNYIISIYKKSDGSTGVSVVDSELSSQPVPEVEEGVFVQLVNAIAGPESASIGLSNLLDPAKTNLSYSLTLATVLPQGQHNVNIAGNETKSLIAEKGKRLLIVATGTEDNIEILSYNYDPLKSSPNDYFIRFLNASPEVSELTITKNNLQNQPDAGKFIENLPYDNLSNTLSIDTEVKISLYYYNPDNFERLYVRVDDLKFNFQKSYTVIFIGNTILGNLDDENPNNDGYSIVILQEF